MTAAVHDAMRYEKPTYGDVSKTNSQEKTALIGVPLRIKVMGRPSSMPLKFLNSAGNGSTESPNKRLAPLLAKLHDMQIIINGAIKR